MASILLDLSDYIFWNNLVHLSHFNSADSKEILSLLHACVHIPSWCNAIVQQRPFISIDALLDVARQQSQTWTWAEIEEALATHPKIGEKKAKKVLSEQETQFSDREQAGVQQDATTQQALLDANIAYEEKFGFIFLIKASGLSSEDILNNLHSRLNNPLTTEKNIVKEQLAAIALLRLSQGVQA